MRVITEGCRGDSFSVGALVLTSFMHALSESRRHLHPAELLKDSTHTLALVGQGARSFNELASESTLLAPVLSAVMH